MKWTDKNIEDWFYWIRHSLRFEFPKISKETIYLRKIESCDMDTWKKKYGPEPGYIMYKEFSKWIKCKSTYSFINDNENVIQHNPGFRTPPFSGHTLKCPKTIYSSEQKEPTTSIFQI